MGPFEITQKVGQVVYRFQLPSSLGGMHDVFYVSRLKKYYPNPQHVLATEEIELQEDLTFKEEPVEVLDCKVKMLRTKAIPMVKVFWKYQDVREATWETDKQMQK